MILSSYDSVRISIHRFCLWILFPFAVPQFCAIAAHEKDLAVGIAGHAFDHLGNIGNQADVAAASGANIIYVSGLGALGYQGLPPEQEFARQKNAVEAYLAHAKKQGIRLAIGYICATSIVKLNTFDSNWSVGFRAGFHSRPSSWRQVDRNGKVLKSWYGGDYEPACMNNPDWRAYEKFMVREQLSAGCDGIFFDNPTVHPEGCYCEHCMRAFDRFLGGTGIPRARTSTPLREDATARQARTLAELRDYVVAHPKEFMQFRCTIARDFFAEMRAYARTIKRDTLITANNSLNSADVLFSQCRTYAYNIHEMSKAEDYVVVEDQSSQPRTLSNGNVIEYRPAYKQLTAISHGKPVIAVTIADGDYHTAPDLVRLAMAEAAANGASYLSWPTWPANQRQRMIDAIRPQADFMRKHAALFKDASARADVVLFLPFRKWAETGNCLPSRIAAALTRGNIQYEVMCEDQMTAKDNARRGESPLPPPLSRTKVFIADPHDLNPTERDLVERFTGSGGILVSPEGQSPDALLGKVKDAIGATSIVSHGPPTLRAVVWDQAGRTIVHCLNLNIQKFSSFEDKITPATDVELEVRVSFRPVHEVRILSAERPSNEKLQFTVRSDAGRSVVKTVVPRLNIAAILVIE